MPVLSTEDGPASRWGALIDYGGSAAFALWTALAFLRPDRVVVSFDTLAYSGPNMALNGSEVQDGRLAQWNDTIFGGAPQLANIHAGVLYPLRMAFSWFDPIRAINLIAVLHVLLLAAGLVVLARRRLSLRAPAGFVAAATVLGSGMLASRSVQLEQLIGLTWLPWLLVAIDGAVRDRQARWPIPATAVVTALLITGGHAQSTFAGLTTAVVWGLARSLDVSVGWAALRRLARPAVGAVLGGLLAAPQVLPTLALTARTSTVSGRKLEDLANAAYVLPLKRVLVAVFGDGTAPSQALATGNFEAATAIGVASCVLALLALVVAVQRRGGDRQPPRARWTTAGLVLIAGAALLLALGPCATVYRIAFVVVPGLDSARVRDGGATSWSWPSPCSRASAPMPSAGRP